MRIVLATLLASLVPILISGLMFVFGGTYPYGPAVALTVVGVAGLVGLLVILGWGLPLHFALAMFERTSWVWYAAVGLLPGPVFVLGLKPFGNDVVQDLLIQAGHCSLIGVVAALVFWYIAVHAKAHS